MVNEVSSLLPSPPPLLPLPSPSLPSPHFTPQFRNNLVQISSFTCTPAHLEALPVLLISGCSHGEEKVKSLRFWWIVATRCPQFMCPQKLLLPHTASFMSILGPSNEFLQHQRQIPALPPFLIVADLLQLSSRQGGLCWLSWHARSFPGDPLTEP